MPDNQSALDTPEWTALLRPKDKHALSKVRQLYLGLYELITSGRLCNGQRLPSSRDLATQLDIGRNTVIAVYAQLHDEQLISTSGRRGTHVSYTIIPTREELATPHPTVHGKPLRTLSSRSQFAPPSSKRGSVLAAGMPDPELFPQTAWRKALSKASRLTSAELGYNSLPSAPLQAALARYLAIYRSTTVDPEQIIITSGTRQSLNLAATLYADPGSHAWLESPGYRGAAEAFHTQGLILEALKVDEQGCCLPNKPQHSEPALIYLTPCFQYPSGAALSADRREQFIRYAASSGAVIFEDDYDSEFRDNSQARPALASQGNGASAAVVLHAGTFSKLIFPAARVAWLVVPHSHIRQAHHCLHMLGGGHNRVAQATVTELLENGSVARHLQKARSVYTRRREAMINALNAAGYFHTVKDTGGSLSMIATLKSPVSARELLPALSQRNLGVQTLESLTWHKTPTDEVAALVLGLGNVKSLQISQTVKQLTNALHDAL